MDNAYFNCSEFITITPPTTCSPLVCDLEVVEISKVCDNQGTPSDESDDVYFVTLAVNSQLPTGIWRMIVNGEIETGNYNTSIELACPVGTDWEVVVSDLLFPDACTQTYTIVSTESCSDEPPCDLSVIVTQVYSDGGTPVNYTDDTYDVTFLVTNGLHTGDYELNIVGVGTFVGTYGTPLEIGTVTANADMTYEITDVATTGCSYIDRIFGQGVIGNYTWIDADADGVQDVGEQPLAGVVVQLTGFDLETGPISLTTTTNEDGLYLFTDLNQGIYQVTFTAPEGYLFAPQDQGNNALDSDANPSTGVTASVVLSSAFADLDIDAGFVLEQNCSLVLSTPVVTCLNSSTFSVAFNVNGEGANGWSAIDNAGVVDMIGTYNTQFIQEYDANIDSPLLIAFEDLADPNCFQIVEIAVPNCAELLPCAMTVTHQVLGCESRELLLMQMIHSVLFLQ
ncbi:MAG: SdrD B-like domain-containing protein [Saprospiraceae bacterium]